MRNVIKMTIRSIKTFFGRYMAILLIVGLSAGFFAGLKITKAAMVNTLDIYMDEQNFYDYRLISTLGFTDDDVQELAGLDGVSVVDGMYSQDYMISAESGDKAFRLIGLPDHINRPSVVKGRLPEESNECVVDDELFKESDIGSVIKIADENEEASLGMIKYKEYTIVGLVDSPLYIGIERDTTSIGSGSLAGFVYILPQCFDSDVYTEVNIKLDIDEAIYSEKYDDVIEKHKDNITDLCETLANNRYEDILKEYGITAELGEQMGILEPDTYVLTREENPGYVSFRNDTGIVSGIANIFPVFFILIAMLVCITTMTRMVDEERTQIGVLKAIGFSDRKIIAKYMMYAGSGTIIGWVIGFFLCTWGLPQIFWYAYNSIYDFAKLPYLFSPVLATTTLVVSLLGILGSTFFACRKELSSLPAKLIRPRAAKNGKRILLERIGILWKHLSFLQKITLRNMFRYKARFIMMLVGIGCSSGLLVTAFGVYDSMMHISDKQFTQIQKYHLSVTFDEEKKTEFQESIIGIEGVESYVLCQSQYVDLLGKEKVSSVNMMSFTDTTELDKYWDFFDDEKDIAYPKKGEVLLNMKSAEKMELKVGDRIEIRDADLNTLEVTVSGIFDNYVYDYIIMSEETVREWYGESSDNTALVLVDGSEEAIAEQINAIESVMSVNQMSKTEELVSEALWCLNYIILMVVGFSAALTFIVIFNLTNINLAERSREIATVQVLGFYPRETESYALKENLVLSVIAGVIGMPLGTVFHYIVMSMIKIDLVAFDVHITTFSYVAAFVLNAVFAMLVNLIMRRQIAKIHMAESLKAVE